MSPTFMGYNNVEPTDRFRLGRLALVGRWGLVWGQQPWGGPCSGPSCNPCSGSFMRRAATPSLNPVTDWSSQRERDPCCCRPFLSGIWSQLDACHDVIMSWWCQSLAQLRVDLLKGFMDLEGCQVMTALLASPAGSHSAPATLRGAHSSSGVSATFFCPLQVPVFTRPPHMHN